MSTVTFCRTHHFMLQDAVCAGSFYTVMTGEAVVGVLYL